MRKGVLLILAVGGVGFATTYFYLQRTPPPPPATPIQARPSPIAKTTSSPIAKTSPRAGNLAPDGTYFLLRYHSVTTDTGVTGFAPGAKVSLVRKVGQTMRVTDGYVEFETDRFANTTTSYRACFRTIQLSLDCASELGFPRRYNS
ncbi:MAG: hypothetical protein DMF04_05100 [Verrucomicrobia bacterium]|nr:MAG: hypothetical protein DMF04_05100 [Verrucomicrobiota bacterium]